MTQSVVQDSPLKPLPGRVRVAGQLTSIGAKALAGMSTSRHSGEDLLRKPAGECGLFVAAPDDMGPGRQLLSLFLAVSRAGKDALRKPHEQ